MYYIDYRKLPECGGSINLQISEDETCIGNYEKCCDLAESLVPEYMAEFQYDVDSAQWPGTTGYYIYLEKETRGIVEEDEIYYKVTLKMKYKDSNSDFAYTDFSIILGN